MTFCNKLHLILLMFFLISIDPAKGRNKTDYNVSRISHLLLKDADAVIRKKNITFNVSDRKSAYSKIVTAVTIFNQEGRSFSDLEIPYDRFKKIKNIEGCIYDKDGELVKELDENDIIDVSDVSNSSIYDESRLKKISLHYQMFPYTVEYSYEEEIEGYVQWPVWVDQETLDAVEYSNFVVTIPSELKLRFWCSQDSVKPTITLKGDEREYVWESKDLKKLSNDVYGDNYEDFATVVRIAPNEFEIDDAEGDMSSWKTFGKWYHDLCKGKDNLPDKVIQEINQLTLAAINPLEKIEMLYKYLQKNNRYVSVQLGIGMWQPYDATYVYEHGYGDCKALSNYMVTLLSKVGIKAFQVLIKSGNARFTFINEFPNQMFNHAIVCVPMEKDTIWLECTSTTNSCGEIGSSNENRQALMITHEGGAVVRTPKSNSNKNVQIRVTNASLKSTGDLELATSILWTGNQKATISSFVEYATPREIEEWISKLVTAPGLNISSHKFIKDEKESVNKFNLNITLLRYGTPGNTRFFFQPSIMETRRSVPTEVDKRYSPVKFNYPYIDIDTVRFTVPDEFIVETVPNNVAVNFPFGKFYSKTTVINNKSILYERYLEINNYIIPPEEYNEYRRFIQQIVAADRAKAILIKRN